MNAASKGELSKGPLMEERLRHYFLGLGYFVLRGVKYKVDRFDVTDVDLWLYGRPSPLLRQRANVDIKNRRTPQALERIFWARGLQLALGLEECIVATTDSRAEIREFGVKNRVTVLDGAFLSRLNKSGKGSIELLSEENFVDNAERGSLGRLGGDWKGRYEAAKSRVLSALDFDGSNATLNDIHYFMGEVITSEGVQKAVALRMLYASVSLFLVSVDFLLKDNSTLEAEQRRSLLANGFRYGNGGKAFVEQLAKMATALVSSSGSSPRAGNVIADELYRQASAIQAEVLAEHFSKNAVQGSIFELAKVFQSAAYSTTVPSPVELSSGCQAVIGVLGDFFALDRKRILQ